MNDNRGALVREYSSGLEPWLEARKDWDSYRKTINSSDPRLQRMDQFTIQLIDLLPHNARVVDLGFGPEARDVGEINRELGREKGIEAIGFDIVSENIDSAVRQNQSPDSDYNPVRGRLRQADITEAIPLDPNSMDGVLLASVIQHLEPESFYGKAVPNIVRILKKRAILYISFKRTDGKTALTKFEDSMMAGKTREQYFYNPDEVIERLEKVGLKLYPGDEAHFGGKITWNDQKRGIPYAGMYFIKD